MVVSSTSMNVGMTTATATIQGLIARRPTAGCKRATLLMPSPPCPTSEACQTWEVGVWIKVEAWWRALGPGGGSSSCNVLGYDPWGSGAFGWRYSPACGPVGGSL